MAKTVFISYRRKDTGPAAGRFYDRLCRVLPPRQVFFDVSTIAGGRDFVVEVTESIKRCDAALVFIGHRWLEPTPDGTVRLHEAGDHVRAEARAALQHAPVVLPVLVDAASMPRAEELPEDIRGITTRNALPLRHETFDDDAERILADVLGTSARPRLWEDRGKPLTRLGYAVAGIVVALGFLAVVGQIHRWIWGVGLAGSLGDAPTVLLLLGGAAGGAWLGVRYEARQRRRRLHRPA
ncbi:MAG TPA: toll/interleukin-1 receptor domain-containing protein [Xanthobacteraceae bacterium]|nr:toll/interleukin-1 receptor domain-containing protein [Xanthobacteraceae bacterium]